jgi:regulator of ribosome biosynthesis
MEVDSEVLDVRAALQASSKKLNELDQAQSGVESTQQMDLGNLLMFSYENVAPEELDQKAVELTQTLVGAVFSLPAERSDVGPLAQLPAGQTVLPRGKPIPQPKAPTRWEQFAREKGIQKRKKSAMEWDPVDKKYKPRWGYGRVDKDDQANPNEEKWVVDAKEGDALGSDPWLERRKAKRERITAQGKNERRNMAVAAKSSTATSGSKSHVLNHVDETLVRRINQAAPGGHNMSKNDLETQVKLAQRSTASMGKFDVKRDAEPKLKVKSKKERATGTGNERDTNMQILNRIMAKEEGQVEMDKAVNQHIAQEQRANKNKKRKSRD